MTELEGDFWDDPVDVLHRRLVSQVNIQCPGCQASCTYAKRDKQAAKIDNAAACSCFLNYLAFLRQATDRAVSVLPWVVSPGRPYGFLWAGSIIRQ
jgi:hypothetical protein